MSDLISRQEAIDAICKAGCGSGHCGISCDDVRAIEQIPSAQQWIPVIRCSECAKGRDLKNTLVKCADDGRIHGKEFYCGDARPKDETKGRWCWNGGWERHDE